MDIRVFPGITGGTIHAPSSKSFIHRYLFCAALADRPTTIICNNMCDDILETCRCLEKIGAEISFSPDSVTVSPVKNTPQDINLTIHESGTTLRFAAALCHALNINTEYTLSERLKKRPVAPLFDYLSGKTDEIDSKLSSQFVSAVMLSMPVSGKEVLKIKALSSSPYIYITAEAMKAFGVKVSFSQNSVCVHGKFSSPGIIHAEGDWSAMAFPLCAGKITRKNIHITGLDDNSVQGDRIITDMLDSMPDIISIDNFPDLAPVIALAAAGIKDITMTNIQRLADKESNRIETIKAVLDSFGIKSEITDGCMKIRCADISAATEADACGDHRIAMLAVFLGALADRPVIIHNAECVKKSYPAFFTDTEKIGIRCEVI